MKKHILIVDDDASIRMLLTFILKQQYRVSTCENGWEALAQLASGEIPDLIIADLDMPKMTGFELLSHIRMSGLWRNLPFVILSGFETPKTREACFQQGASAYLLKPFNPEIVKREIAAAIESTPFAGYSLRAWRQAKGPTIS
ncbi:response regulator [Pontibacter sp. G13]|uniref:response regulator n=1 Tax=Pontibacter sp. G13 TaxID=3074898 RepID=UPI0028891D0A|nr:response regulator [Pontibacter sp. G13]WNJ21114.1 response regulator [Pontibacter sp. G13]